MNRTDCTTAGEFAAGYVDPHWPRTEAWLLARTASDVDSGDACKLIGGKSRDWLCRTANLPRRSGDAPHVRLTWLAIVGRESGQSVWYQVMLIVGLWHRCRLNGPRTSGVGDVNLSSIPLVKRRLQPWQAGVCVVVSCYLALGVATHTVRAYHWVALAAIPVALVASSQGRRFFLDWTPLFTFWLVYDRLRLLQPLLYERVAVRVPYEIERWMFGWLGGGDAPAHAWRAWLSAQNATYWGPFIGWSAQLIYLSYLLILPLHLFLWWLRGRSRIADRRRFVRHLSAFTALHVMALLIYVLAPVAPPWWVSLHGLVQPTTDLVANTSMAAAMDGVIVQKMIKNAAQWFGAVPSLHAAYPMLFLLLSLRDRSRFAIVSLSVYSFAMCLTTVVLNQHYIIDLLAAAVLAVGAWLVADRVRSVWFGDEFDSARV